LIPFPWTAVPLKMGPKGCPETSLTNYQSTLHHFPEVRWSNVHRS